MKTYLVSLLFIFCSYSPYSFARLGELPTDSTQEQSATHRLKISHFKHYDLHEHSQKWLNLHEFVGQDQKVFALTWKGKSNPKLDTYLGSHLVQFQKALVAARGTHRHGGTINATVDGLHVEMEGHMGAVSGRVWLVNQLPPGVGENELR